MTAPTLTPEAQAAIEQALALHRCSKDGDWCDDCKAPHPCPTRTILSALLPPPEPTVEVTNGRALEVWRALHPDMPDYLTDGYIYAQRLIAAGLCPAAWLPAPPEDERVRELREAAQAFIPTGLFVPGSPLERLRAALQAWDEPT